MSYPIDTDLLHFNHTILTSNAAQFAPMGASVLDPTE